MIDFYLVGRTDRGALYFTILGTLLPTNGIFILGVSVRVGVGVGSDSSVLLIVLHRNGPDKGVTE